MIHIGDCLEVMRGMADNSVDAIVTDPPYGLSFMGKRWDYDVPSTEIWAECLRVLKPGGHLLAFAGTRTQHRMAVRIEDAGFEIRDMIAWVYGSGFPKSHNGEWGGTALKPALEPITVARKPLIGTVEANWREHGTGALNIDVCRVATSESTVRARTESDLGRLNDDGWRPTPGLNGSDNGRWPANLIHDGSDEVLAAFPPAPGQQGVAKTDGSPQDNAIYGALRHGTKQPNPRGDTGSAARFFYCAKATRSDRDAGLDGFRKSAAGMVSNTSGQHMTRRDEGYQVAPRANHHPTVKPTDLMRYLCRLVTPAGGLVLDPFMGSGSTGKAAVLEGFQFVGIELDASYAAIAQARIRAAQPGLPFGDVA
ncbi:MAG: site-specific DNA-methyltransferase [Stenotrophomonas sp.]|nr:site-specific DNA-methyltransferase [Stenotrophomonas sp.]